MVLSGKNQNETDDCVADILKGGAVRRLQGVSTRITISLARMIAYGTNLPSDADSDLVWLRGECVAKLFWSVRAQASAEFDSFAGSLVNEDSHSHQRHRMRFFQ
jgi:hypothetical protein